MDIYDKVLGRLICSVAAVGMVGGTFGPLIESVHGETPSDENVVGMVQPLTMPHGYERDYGSDPRPWGRASVEIPSSVVSNAHAFKLDLKFDPFGDSQIPSSSFFEIS